MDKKYKVINATPDNRMLEYKLNELFLKGYKPMLVIPSCQYDYMDDGGIISKNYTEVRIILKKL